MSAVGAAVGVAIDAVAGEPPLAWHPVARFGGLMARVEQGIYADRRARGAAYAVAGVGLGAGAGWALQRLLGAGPAAAVAVAGCSAGRMLDREARAVTRLLRGPDPAAARERLRALVGRDTAGLDAAEISRAVIESVAENSVDAVTATVWWAVAGGAPAALAHRAVNTLDAMVGHRDDRYARFGWASARLDDVANFVPARLTALAVAAVRPRRAGDVWRTVRRDAPRHPSPNGGVVEAAFAAALGVRLGGVNRYGEAAEDRGTLGDGRPPGPADVEAAVRLRRHVTIASCAAALGVAGVRRRRSRPRRQRVRRSR